MKDVYYNELSADSSFVNLPSTQNDAKNILYHFIKSCIAYILAKGVDQNPVMLIHKRVGLFTSLNLHNTETVSDILLELYNEGSISQIEMQKFQLFINDSFSKSWDGEYQFNKKEVFGIGKAKEDGSYVISFATSFITGGSDWSRSQYKITKIPSKGNNGIKFERNIASPKHVFQKYKIWKGCKFKLTTPSMELLPNRFYLETIAQAYDFENWPVFYDVIQKTSKTVIKEVSKIVAAVNGWKESRECPHQYRLLFKGKNYYLATDTQHGTFEVYKGPDEHQGEIYFNDDKINSQKQDNRRAICGKKR
ncbi:hypothetical protein [Carboxylicivirga marina]|uniref:hypothetical protein n=1 Tax=Carboxylicivirga marina TaxID=2800988 RepID=UPI002598A278|nr:hypothetical protein [uncultured Carboxylicivirga sp.]